MQLQSEDVAHLYRQLANARVPLPAWPQNGSTVVGHAAQQVAEGVHVFRVTVVYNEVAGGFVYLPAGRARREQ